jgi:tetratricopeptide (TPR) repeat protein
MLQLATGGSELMRRSEQISMVWSLARESSTEGARLRRRIAVIGAMSLLVCGFLASIGLGVIVLAFVVGVVISAGAVAFAAVWPDLRARLHEPTARLRSRAHTSRTVVGPLWRRARRWSLTAFSSARSRVAEVRQDLVQSARSTAIRFAPRPARHEPQRDALRLNAVGTQHRRDGRYDDAVECHRQALEILRELGDRRGVALTQSNLALALSRSGDDEWAIGLFEEAAATLHDLGDEEREAQIMANLGLAHRRHGRLEEGENVLELALAKLSPESSAYHQIEAELRRAS